jgi:hypothetical protein
MRHVKAAALAARMLPIATRCYSAALPSSRQRAYARRCPDEPSVRGRDEAIEQADEADEGRLEASGSTMVGKAIVNVGKVVRPSQLIRGVRRT